MLVVHVVSKGKRANEVCGVYTSKIGSDGKNYCSGHTIICT